MSRAFIGSSDTTVVPLLPDSTLTTEEWTAQFEARLAEREARAVSRNRDTCIPLNREK